ITRFFPGKKIDEIREDFYSISTLIILSTTSFSIVLYFFPLPLANAIFDGEVIVVKLTSIIIFVRCVDQLFIEVFRAFREMKKYTILDVSTRYGEIGLATILVLIGYGLVGALIAVIIARGFLFLFLVLLIRKKIPFTFPKFKNIKEYLKFGLPTIPSTFSYWIIKTSDRYLIGFFLGTTFVGYYAPGYALGNMVPYMIVGILGFVLTPTLSSYYDENNIPMIKSVLNLCMKYFLLFSIPYLIGAILLGRSLLVFLTTTEIAKEGYIILYFSGLAAIFYGIKVIFQQILLLKKMTKLIASFHFIAAIVNLTGNIYLIPRIGMIAAGITTSLSYFLSMCLTIYFAYRELTIKINYKSIINVIISSLLMGITVYLLRLYIWSNLFFLITIGTGAYFFVLYIIGGIKKNEINYLKDIIG
ncbi:MAG: polysaccharide biosynthesis C-terminal domain-containing protein, partial [archaeon]